MEDADLTSSMEILAGDDDSEDDVITVDSSASAEERITSMTYDVYGNLLTVTDPEGKLTSYSYDKCHRCKW